jgi:hypothetical protein
LSAASYIDPDWSKLPADTSGYATTSAIVTKTQRHGGRPKISEEIRARCGLSHYHNVAETYEPGGAV